MGSLQPLVAGASWTPAQNLHCTLSFLGTVDEARIPAISDALGAAVAELIDFPTHLSGLGAFPSTSRARVVWAGLADEAGGIASVADGVHGALETLGFARPERRFRAHVTLARLRAPRRVDLDAGIEPVRFSIDRITLFESRLGRPHAVHTALATFPFRRELAPPRPD